MVRHELGEQPHLGVFQPAVLGQGRKLGGQRRGGGGYGDQAAGAEVGGDFEDGF